MASPGYIRVFACTDDSMLSHVALEYVRSLLRIAPVRLVPMTPGGLEGPWRAFEGLLVTPMPPGPFVNAVICDPARWTWVQAVPMPEADVTTHELVAGSAADAGTDAADPFEGPGPDAEVASGRLELYTAGVRNVLFAVASPRDGHQLATARKYDAIVVPDEAHSIWWSRRGSMERVVLIRSLPGVPVDHHAVRGVISPKEHT